MVEPHTLLAGPRGRRLLLAFALASERILVPDYEEWSLHPAVMHAAYYLDPGRGASRKMISLDGGDHDLPLVTPEEVAIHLAEVPLAEVTPEQLRTALAEAVDNARYWQEPDGEDVLAATQPVRSALERVARHIAESCDTGWWDDTLPHDMEWSVQWIDESVMPPTDPAGIIASWRADVALREERALRERPADPAANFGGHWWSVPPLGLLRTSRTLFDGSPAGLWFVEDRGNEEVAIAVPRRIPEAARVYEVTGADAWGELCRRFPLDVTGEKRHDWYRTTGRVGKWAMPNWSLVSQHYEGVRLAVAGYLATAGTAIAVDDDTASMIAGWNPDETWWFVNLAHAGEPVRWARATPR